MQNKKRKNKIYRSKLLEREQILAYKLLLPTIIILFVIAFYPLGQVFVTSFTNKKFASNQKTKFIGIKNYKVLLTMKVFKIPYKKDEKGNIIRDHSTGKPIYEKTVNVLPRKPIRFKKLFKFKIFNKAYVVGATDSDFIKAIGNTITFTILSVFLETIIGLAIALIVNKKFKGQGVMRAVMLIPWAVITVVSARIWEVMLVPDRTGMFNALLSSIGIGNGDISFLTESLLQIPTIVVVDVWKTSPFMALILLAGLQLIPEDLYKAASVDGANEVRKFFSITLPLLRPSLAVALVFRTLDALRVFDVFQVLLSTRRYSMASYNYQVLIKYRDMGLASAIGVIIFFLIAIFAITYTKMVGINSKKEW